MLTSQSATRKNYIIIEIKKFILTSSGIFPSGWQPEPKQSFLPNVSVAHLVIAQVAPVVPLLRTDFYVGVTLSILGLSGIDTLADTHDRLDAHHLVLNYVRLNILLFHCFCVFCFCFGVSVGSIQMVKPKLMPLLKSFFNFHL